MVKKVRVTEELPDKTITTEKLPEEELETNEEQAQSNSAVDKNHGKASNPGMVTIIYSPSKHDWPGMLNGTQVHPGEIHTVPYSAYLEVQDNEDYKAVE
jgi:hypothetical protein